MKGKTHLIYGTGVGIMSAIMLSEGDVVAGLGIAGITMLGSLMPDIDSRTSKVAKKAKLVAILTNKLFGHRGFLHSPACILVTLLLGRLILSYAGAEKYTMLLYGYLCGYGSHLFLDFLTKGGIPLLCPLTMKKFHLTNVKTGGKGEKYLFAGVCVVSLILLGTYFTFKYGLQDRIVDTGKNVYATVSGLVQFIS